MTLYPFHLAIPVHDIEQARAFYGGLLGFAEGRSSARWVDFDCYGHQLVVHLHEGMQAGPVACNPVDGHSVPVPHFGVVLPMEAWRGLADRLEGRVAFVIEPYIRFAGQAGEQGTLFFSDPSGNMLEFKGFANIEASLFAR